MKAIVLAAGEGRRCRPLTLTRSKVMLPVANKPILEHVINALAKNDVKDIILIVGYEKERIMDYFEDGIDFGVKIHYIEQKAQIGTAHAILQARKEISTDDQAFLVVNGDNIIEPETISDLIKGANGDATILACKKENVTGYGVIVAEGQRVKKIVEKPQSMVSHLINTGIYLFKPQIFDLIERTPLSTFGEYAITDTLQIMIDEGMEVMMTNTYSDWLDAAFSWDLLKANPIVLGEFETDIKDGTVEEGAIIKGSVSIGKNTTVRSGCYIVGPVMIGDNCDIGPNTVILPSTSVGNNVSIASFTSIQNSIIMNDARISTHSTISNSIIGSNTSVESHFITEEKEKMMIDIEGGLYFADKLGTIIGDDTEIGSNVLVKAGMMISPNCRVNSGKIISEALPVNSIVI
ncbi:bifunctional sugar-1-phosphate nucleotidylyltransferase/acetyltransferase [Methanolobus halotolerans]|uniref:Bifunctional protein GlmU n=1 Tax=Methanolobus halotolerans TaxID=2052935 RepID=A0A4E0Q6R3_9EURY|nr:bifunctional sugar-1-phosphate nucleotidylyltransferase/acetyltransferase [Methanolobus halotolerans]TGC10577.1 glucose-1-phosphate thymidylyltransferase [Methanolobus halotolerans]